MRTILLLLITCSSMFGQGFGSFTYDQPFLAGRNATNPIPQDGLFLDFNAALGVSSANRPLASGDTITNIVEQSHNWPNTIYTTPGTALRWVSNGTYATNIFFNWTNYSGMGIIATNSTDTIGPEYTGMFVLRVDDSKIGGGQYYIYGPNLSQNSYNTISIPSAGTLRPWNYAPYDSPSSWISQKWFLLTVGCDGLGNGFLKTNGIVRHISGLPVETWQWNIGTIYYNGAQTFPGDMTRILFWKRLLTPAQMHSAEVQLMTDYGIEQNSFYTNANFNPSSISGLKLWVKSDTGVEAQYGGTNGTTVFRWRDQSGNGNHLYNANGNTTNYSTGPKIYLIGPNFYPYLDFTSGYMKTIASLGISQPTTIFVVMKHAFNTTTKFLFDSPDTREAFFDDTDTHLFAGTVANIGAHQNFSSYSQLTCVFNGASSLARLNGSQIGGTLSVGSNGIGNFYLGCATDTNAKWQGPIVEVLIYSANLSSTDRGNVENYLKARYAL